VAEQTYRWLEPCDDMNIWQAVVVDHPEVNASCAEQYETNQETGERLMGYVVESWNSQMPLVNGEPATSDDFVWVDPPEGYVPPFRSVSEAG